MDSEKRFELIARNTEEILTREELKKAIDSGKQLSDYIGLATTGPFHMGYFIPFVKMLEFEKAGIKNIVLIADIHAALDDLKAPWEELEQRAWLYEKCVELGFPWKSKPKIVKGSSYQLKSDYQKDVLKLGTMTTVDRAKRAASEVCRLKNPKVSEMVYPIMQALDEQYLNVDIQLGGTDQRHVLAYAREALPKLGYKPRIEVITPLMTSLKGPGQKMSASVPESIIKPFDSVESIKKKISKAYCVEGEIKDNPIMQLYQFFVFPLKGKIKIVRDKKFGGDVQFESYAELEKAFIAKQVHPMDLKNALSNELIETFAQCRKFFEKNSEKLKALGPNFAP